MEGRVVLTLPGFVWLLLAVILIIVILALLGVL
jgi:hypothetical protein